MRLRRGRGFLGSRTEGEGKRRNSYLERDLMELEDLLLPFSVEIDDQAHARILTFAKELISWNDRLNLLSRSDAPNVIKKHVAASIAVFLVEQPTSWARWIDVGTGAGFPGLILKIIRSDLNMTLVDSARKRCLFLENTLRMMDLGRVPILPFRVETMVARGEGLGSYDVLTSRAVAPLSETLTAFGPLLAPSGKLVTFKGPQWMEELEGAKSIGVLDSAGFDLETATRIPWTAGHLLGFRKRS